MTISELLDGKMRYATFMKVTTARRAKWISVGVSDYEGVYLIICNQNDELSKYPYTLYNKHILSRAGRKIGSGLDVLDIIESKFKFKVRADNKGLHWLDIYSNTYVNKILFSMFISKKEYDTLRKWFI